MKAGVWVRKWWRPRSKGQRTSLILVSSWWTVLFIYFVTSRAFLLREQPFVLDWLWWVLLMLPFVPAVYSWLFLRRIHCGRSISGAAGKSACQGSGPS